MLSAVILASCAAQPQQTGFRGIAWGTPISEVKEHMFQIPNSKWSYVRTGDNMALGGAQLESVSYEVYRDRFSSALLTSRRGADKRIAMKAAFEAQFGPGLQNNAYLEEYAWFGPVTGAFLDCSKITEECKALIFSTTALAQKKVDDAATATKGKKDF
jgi:hypothetical protein